MLWAMSFEIRQKNIRVKSAVIHRICVICVPLSDWSNQSMPIDYISVNERCHRHQTLVASHSYGWDNGNKQQSPCRRYGINTTTMANTYTQIYMHVIFADKEKGCTGIKNQCSPSITGQIPLVGSTFSTDTNIIGRNCKTFFNSAFYHSNQWAFIKIFHNLFFF